MPKINNILCLAAAVFLLMGCAPANQSAPPDTADEPAQRQCISWFDGCNSCSARDNGLVICTERYCTADEYTEYKCYKWKEE